MSHKVSISEIQQKVAMHFRVRLADMTSDRRARVVARPRQVAMWLAKEMTSQSLPAIGRQFNRDHTTVMHAVKRVTSLMERDDDFCWDVLSLRIRLEHQEIVQ